MSASTVHRPTENAAIGRVRPPQVPPVGALLELRRQARIHLDRAFEHLINGALSRALQSQGGEL